MELGIHLQELRKGDVPCAMCGESMPYQQAIESLFLFHKFLD